MEGLAILRKLAPTVATAFLGPLGGAAVAAVGELLGLTEATKETIAKTIEAGQISPDQLGKLQEMELEYRNNEKERGFKYAELAFRDRDSARVSNVAGGVQGQLFWLTLVLLAATLGCEITILFVGLPTNAPDLLVGRVLGLMDSVALMCLSYWFGSSSSSRAKDSSIDLLAARK